MKIGQLPAMSGSWNFQKGFKLMSNSPMVEGTVPGTAPAGLGVGDYQNAIDGGGVKNPGVRLDLIPAEFLWELGEVYTFGAQKYADNNWMRGYKWSKSIAALLRHLFRWLMGQDRDKETGRHELAHVAWHCATLIYYSTYEQYRRFDDRAKRPTEISAQTAANGTGAEPKG
jgi:hypothetical protein